MEIIEITTYTPELWEAVKRFLEQLTPKEVNITESFLEELIRSENSHLFCTVDETGQYLGMLTLGSYLSPTGSKAWIEDVVVDESCRGKGIGEELVKHAIHFAKEKGVQLLMLTSNPTRIVANTLYPKLGFVRKETNAYRMLL